MKVNMDRTYQILSLFNQFRKNKKWDSFYIKSVKEVIISLKIPPHTIIECTLEEMSINEDFCIPLFISNDDLFFPSILECFKHTSQNQIVAILTFDKKHEVDNLSICYIHKNQLSYLKKFNV